MVPRRFDQAVVLRRLNLSSSLLRTPCEVGAKPNLELVERLAVERILIQLVDLAVGINTHVSASMGTGTPLR